MDYIGFTNLRKLMLICLFYGTIYNTKEKVMTEELLMKIRDESQKEIDGMDKYNEYADRRNELANIEEIKKYLGLPYTRNMELPRKSEKGIIMATYDRYVAYIDEKDTNEIYVYIGTYRPSDFTCEEIEDGAPFEIEVDRNDPTATSRRYSKLEGVWGYSFNIEDSEEFERTHTVIFVDDFYQLQSEFIMTAVKESQEKAVSKVLKKYNNK